ncbi:MAG: choline dehydrogenase [Alphaproteobacteria bacterium]|nr:choline dehydrogenase [Alphaproteobacteria bacterium]
MATDGFDYVIIGAGSAGCVLASRLSEDGKHTVLVLEAGGGDSSVFIQMPTALSIPMGMDKYNWGYHTEPEPYMDGRRMDLPRGKVIGGGSSVNGMVYIRGNAMDYEGWEDQGAKGWGYRNVLPYFRKAETRAEGGDAWRGNDGPLHTSYGPMKNPLYSVFVEAATQAGYAATEDVNGFRQEGFGRMDRTIHRGKRWSAASAYLKPAMNRKNLAVRTGVRVTKLDFEGKRAVAVRYLKGGIETIVQARREIILAGGSINSPQLLKLSGIGPADELKALGINPVHHLAGVGENLQDHLEFYFQQACTQPITLFSHMNPIGKALIGIQWFLFKNGLGATNHFESCGFIRSRAGVPYADIQYHFLPAAIAYDGSVKAEAHGFQAHVGPMRSKSRGWVRLASADPLDKPKVLFNYMSHEDDRIEMRACVRLTREIFGRHAFDAFRGEELQPGKEIVSDEAIDAFVRQKAESAYHPCGTCKMGDPTDPMAVVDPETRVIGLEGLRVVDTSIIPQITTGNLNAPAIMIGEKASDLILGREPLPASNAPYFIAPDWQTRQR